MAAMDVILKADLQGVDWEHLAEVYRTAFNSSLSAQRTRSIFERCYLTRIALVSGAEVGGVYALSDGELDAAIYEVAQSAPLLAAGMNGLEEGTDSMSVSSSEVLEVGGGSMPPSTSCRGR